jgi:two-component system nitrogen regulation response regulator GlnG
MPVSAAEPGSAPALDWVRYINERLDAGSHELYAECLTLMERQLITRVLQHTEGNQLQAAKVLGITRGSLRHKLRALGIAIERSVGSDDETGG